MIESLTPSEAAVVSGVSVRDVHRMIDEHILPEALYTVDQTRSFKSEACALISFYFRSATRLTSEERQRTITRASESIAKFQTIRDEFLTIDLTPFLKEVKKRLERLHAAQKIVVSDPEILGGTLVIRGTRVPVYDVAASVTAGIPVDRILAAYPSLKRNQVELAALYVEANPQRGRPRQKAPFPECNRHLKTHGDHLQASMTKLLIDECLSAELALMAREQGHHEASHVVWIGKSGWKDWELKRVLLDEDWVLVTRNCKDFADLNKRQVRKAFSRTFHFTLASSACMGRPE